MGPNRTMLFASATAVAGILVALGALAAAAMPAFRVMTIFWCFVPALWGIWAAVVPSGWARRRLPLWGALLGIVLALIGGVALDLPSRVLGQSMPVAWRAMAIPIAAAIYYVVWMAVGALYHRLSATPPTNSSRAARAA